jgi:Antp family protein
MKQESLKSAQHHSNKQSQQDHTIPSSNQSSGGLGGHLHHPAIVSNNELKLGLGGMGGNLSMMGGHLDNKTSQDILKAVNKVNS